jgi:hypothetical protein
MRVREAGHEAYFAAGAGASCILIASFLSGLPGRSDRAGPCGCDGAALSVTLAAGPTAERERRIINR